ncbi:MULTISPECIES: hybrid sensor histidine kinase/response regulator [Oxalobacteraceae]|uniref:ATP-binding response regulator n=1 Tax=Herminiimonas sp. Marseille-P9896 TaxID=2742211 RepID=UPI00158C0866|nr:MULTISPECIES: hybrid sensor histidine kinase/response regulator [Oxalobacteraceae]
MTQPSATNNNSLQADQIYRAQMAVLRHNFPFSLLGALLTAVLIVLVLHDVFPMRDLLLWLGLNCLLLACRFGIVLRYRSASADEQDVSALQRWERWTLWSTAAAGLLWGLPYAYWMYYAPFEQQMFLIVGLLTLGTGAIYAYCIHLRLLYAFEIPYFAPPFVILALLPGSVHHILAVAGALYLLVTLAFAHRMYRTQLDSLRMRFENTDLLKKLAIEKEAAERSNLAKSRFLAAASHDLRQPVHALSLYLGVLREQDLNPKSRQLVDHIGRATLAMGGLFDGLLNISRLDAGVIRPQRRHFRLAPILEQLLLEYTPQASAQGLRLRLHRGPWPVVQSDPVLLDRILRNLVDNAIRHTRNGGVLIGCRRRGNTLRIEVWDSGVGIAAAEQENIFMEFHQVDNPERDRSKGMGLGLAIVRRTADLLKHPLTLRSRPGRGSVFSLSLPLGDAHTADPVAHKAEVPKADGQWIFVIDDDADNLQGLRLLLETWDYKVVTGHSGDDILQAAAHCPHKPDLILSDFRLRAHETGIEVIDRLHEEYADDTIPAVLLTGDTDPRRLIEASARAWPLLHKPVDAAHLRRVLAQMLEHGATEAAVNTPL